MSHTPPSREWIAAATRLLLQDAQRTPRTPLVELPLPVDLSVRVLLKDETAHPTGSLKHRLARALFLHAVVDGTIGPDTPIVEAASGSTAVSEAYFARELGLQFIAVVPRGTSPRKLALIESFGGRIHTVADPALLGEESIALARRLDGHFMDQFANASRVTDWLGEQGLAAELFAQLAEAGLQSPGWIVAGAGTGGTTAAMGRYCRSRGIATRVALAAPERASYYGAVGRRELPTGPSRIEGIGRPSVEPSFVGSVIDAAFRVDDAQSVAAMELLGRMTGHECGPSTGTNVVVAMYLATQMHARDETGIVVTLMCDAADRYRDTYYSPDWLMQVGMDPSSYREPLETAVTTGRWVDGRSPVGEPLESAA